MFFAYKWVNSGTTESALVSKHKKAPKIKKIDNPKNAIGDNFRRHRSSNNYSVEYVYVTEVNTFILEIYYVT